MPETISKEKLKQLQKYFLNKVKTNQGRRIEATMLTIAEESGISLATCHKGIKELVGRGVLEIRKTKSRRFPNVYIYTGDVDEIIEFVDKDAELDYLRKKVKKQRELINKLKSDAKRS